MRVSRKWSMPSKNTFSIKPIKDLILEYYETGKTVVDPFANNMNIKQYLREQDYFSKFKDEIARVLTPYGVCISCGWNSNGIGKTRGFKLVEILLIAHGGSHNDTIVTVEYKSNNKQKDK